MEGGEGKKNKNVENNIAANLKSVGSAHDYVLCVCVSFIQSEHVLD